MICLGYMSTVLNVTLHTMFAYFCMCSYSIYGIFCGIPAILGKRRADTTSFVVVAATKLDSVLDNN